MDDLSILLVFMTLLALSTFIAAYLMYRYRVVRFFRSLRWAFLSAILLTVVLIFINVWVLMRLMFISEYDLQVTAAIILFAGLVALSIGFMVSRVLTDGIRDMVRTAEQLAAGDRAARVAVEGNDELAAFAQRFNWMADRLQEMDEKQRALEQSRRDLIAWASHDLRTPLTAIRVMAEAMHDKVVDDPATIHRYIGNMMGEIRSLSHLIDNLFELAQLDAGHLKLEYQPASLHDLISDTLGSMSARATIGGITLSGDVDPAVDPVEMAADKIQRVLNNLLDNALRYTPSGGEVELKAECGSTDRVIVTVRNYAPGMLLPDVSQLFTRFYRREEARAQSKDGYRGAGLGLAITRGFIDAHGGTIHAMSSPDSGMTIQFTLPRTRTHPLKP
ncbi:MAG: ATP-binding protein [bacterium]|nr:ATP-binding protein [bacterium]